MKVFLGLLGGLFLLLGIGGATLGLLQAGSAADSWSRSITNCSSSNLSMRCDTTTPSEQVYIVLYQTEAIIGVGLMVTGGCFIAASAAIQRRSADPIVAAIAKLSTQPGFAAAAQQQHPTQAQWQSGPQQPPTHQAPRH